MKNHHGQSLVELLVCLVIGTLLLCQGFSSLGDALQRSRQTQAVNQLLGVLHYARGSAVMARGIVGICAGPNGCAGSHDWRQQLWLFADSNHNGQFDAGEQLLRQEPFDERYSWHWTAFAGQTFVQFEADGSVRAGNGSFTLCEGNRPIQQIVINVAGRPRSQKPAATANCS